MGKLDIWPPPNLTQHPATRYDVFERVHNTAVSDTDVDALMEEVLDHVGEHVMGDKVKRIVVYVVLDEVNPDE